ncbi:hypothetical protein ACW7EJ_04235, partial [Acinetobacter soli]
RNEGEGIKSIINEFLSLISEGKLHLIFYLILLNITKYVGYKKGMLSTIIISNGLTSIVEEIVFFNT